MQVVKSYPDGMFSWVDLSTSDLEGAKAFYGGLFGWEAHDTNTDMGTIYTMFKLNGQNVAGAGPMNPDMLKQGVPPVWTSYVKHDDVDAVVGRAKEAGGSVLMDPMDVMQEGRMTMIADPIGAVFGVWQPRNHIGAQLVNVPNTLIWNELQTPNTEGARAFYSQVFGWEYAVDENGYVIIRGENNRMQAGMIQMDESWGDVPPNWAVYFMVTDLEASVAKVNELGGQVLVPVSSAGETGKFAVVRDPQAGAFSLMEFSGPVDSPPGY